MNPRSKATLFYDLEVGPESFDFPMFLLLAKQWLDEGDFEDCELVILPGKKDGYRSTGNPHDIIHSNWRLRQLLTPSALAFLPQASLKICRRREEAISIWNSIKDKKTSLYPQNYDPNSPQAIFSIKAFCDAERRGETTARFKSSPQALDYIDQWIESNVGKRKLVTITLRQASYQSTRNSDIKSWIHFAETLDSDEYFPLFVPDIEFALKQRQGIQDFPVFSEACYNIELRFALYKRAWLNMLVNTGPSNLCAQTDDIPYLYFKLVTPGIECSDLAYFEKETFLPSSQWPCSGPYQKLIWEDDSFDAISKAFELMADRLNDTKLWNEAELRDRIQKLIEEDNIDEATQWSACSIAFFPTSLKTWLLRAECLLRSNRSYESFLTLINASERFPGASEEWSQLSIGNKLNSIQANLKKTYAQLMQEGLDWRVKRSFSSLENSRDGNISIECFLFGAGQGGQNAITRLPSWVKPKGVLDNDTSKHGNCISNLSIHPPGFALQQSYDAILIASGAGQEIFEQLCLKGFPADKLYILEPKWILPEEHEGPSK